MNKAREIHRDTQIAVASDETHAINFNHLLDEAHAAFLSRDYVRLSSTALCVSSVLTHEPHLIKPSMVMADLLAQHMDFVRPIVCVLRRAAIGAFHRKLNTTGHDAWRKHIQAVNRLPTKAEQVYFHHLAADCAGLGHRVHVLAHHELTTNFQITPGLLSKPIDPNRILRLVPSKSKDVQTHALSNFLAHTSDTSGRDPRLACLAEFFTKHTATHTDSDPKSPSLSQKPQRPSPTVTSADAFAFVRKITLMLHP